MEGVSEYEEEGDGVVVSDGMGDSSDVPEEEEEEEGENLGLVLAVSLGEGEGEVEGENVGLVLAVSLLLGEGVIEGVLLWLAPIGKIVCDRDGVLLRVCVRVVRIVGVGLLVGLLVGIIVRPFDVLLP